MKTSATGRTLIESFEGLILQAYDDANDHVVKPGETPKGVLTIGYGHTSSAGLPKVTVGQKITKEEADKILASDLTKVEQQVTDLVKVPLNQNQFDALVSFQFNLGALGKSTLLKKLNTKDYTGAAEQFLVWNKAPQLGPGPRPGLVRRRQAEKTLFLKPYTSVTPAAGAIILTAGAATAVASQGHKTAYIIAGIMLAGLAVWAIYKLFKKD